MRFRKPGIQVKTDKITPRVIRVGYPKMTAVKVKRASSPDERAKPVISK